MRGFIARLRRLALPGVGALALAACASGAPSAESAADAALDPAEHVALALAEADSAAEAGEPDRLARAVRIVEGFAARPLEGSDDPLPGWREQAGDLGPPMRGSPLGPGYRRGRLEAGEAARIQQLFLSGERAKIVLSAPNGAALALRVLDAREAEICGRKGTPNHCQWVPVFTQRYSIEIVNRSSAPARYYLVVE